MRYATYQDIPAKVRRFILDESGARRVKQISLAYCNELADEYFEYEAECAELKKFQLHVERSEIAGAHEHIGWRRIIFPAVSLAQRRDKHSGIGFGERGSSRRICQKRYPCREGDRRRADHCHHADWIDGPCALQVLCGMSRHGLE